MFPLPMQAILIFIMLFSKNNRKRNFQTRQRR
jgi:hypothetical protein